MAITHQLHEEILIFLLNQKKNNPELRFTLRRSNRFGRLDEGLWFYGYGNYIAISFWTGMDWKNKTPNIYFAIDEEGNSYLGFTSSDSVKKTDFIQDKIRSHFKNGKGSKTKWHVPYNKYGKDYISMLEDFLENDKKFIDKAVSASARPYFKNEDYDFNKIDFIGKEEYNLRLENIFKYRGKEEYDQLKKLPVTLDSFEIREFGPINKVTISNISPYVHWIIFTGLNGTGKSSILKALTTAFCRNHDHAKKVINKDFEIKISLKIGHKKVEETIDNDTPYNQNLLYPGFAAYGPIRQMIKTLEDEESRKRSSIARSMFHPDSLLLDLDQQLSIWIESKKRSEYQHFSNVKEKIGQIVEILPEIIPSLVKIEPPSLNEKSKHRETLYTEEDGDENKHEAVTFNELASGLKSMVAMFGDMMLRLFAQQPEVNDPAELRGIVLIDELDVHLHPILQKRLPELLTGIFRNIQFIATTHSPIPLLGIPANSIIYRVDRDTKEKVKIKQLKDIDLVNLLPNALLTSPIFGMDELKSSSNADIRKINVDDNYREDTILKTLDKEIDKMFKNNKWIDSKLFKKSR